VALPAIPAQPATRAGRTPFQMGIVRGIERGKGWSGGIFGTRNDTSLSALRVRLLEVSEGPHMASS
jgi:hypothetical protein